MNSAKNSQKVRFLRKINKKTVFTLLLVEKNYNLLVDWLVVK